MKTQTSQAMVSAPSTLDALTTTSAPLTAPGAPLITVKAAPITFDQRVTALDGLGLTPRQTRFVATVALHGGYCLRRQYVAFAGLAYGKNVRDFLDGLVARHLAERCIFHAGRGFVYHLNARSIYRALGQQDNRNRRHVSPALIARKIMVLDFVLGQPEVDWYATEQDKVALFTQRFNVPRVDLPCRSYDSADLHQQPTTRYFIHKLPIFLVGDPPVVHFVYLVNEPTGRGLEQFLEDHARLLKALPAWAVVAVCPERQRGLAECRTAFDRHRTGLAASRTALDISELKWYFGTRRLVDQNELRVLSVADIHRYRGVRARLQDARVDRLYETWLRDGDRAIEAASALESTPTGTPAATAAGASRGTVSPAPNGTLLLRELPFRYSQFGALPGVA